jgi:hypothetical protein
MALMARGASWLLVLAWLAAAPGATAQEPSVADVLTKAAAYVEQFQKQLSGIVAEEDYTQEIKNAPASVFITKRRLKSDLLLVRPIGADRWVEFRDVFEVDGRKVRDRDERLSKLFLDPPDGAATQLKRVMSESARYNIGDVERNMNTPVLALGFLLRDYRTQFEFKRLKESMPDAWVLEYHEVVKPTLIRTPVGINLPASGRFWIDPATGAVSKTELIVHERDLTATVTVTYGSQPSLDFLVPTEMVEFYVMKRERIDGRATYGRFRKFQVAVDEAIHPVKKPGGQER